jgi:hypothetical protein
MTKRYQRNTRGRNRYHGNAFPTIPTPDMMFRRDDLFGEVFIYDDSVTGSRWLSQAPYHWEFGRSGTVATGSYLRGGGDGAMTASHAYYLQYDFVVQRLCGTWGTSVSGSSVARVRRSGVSVSGALMSGTAMDASGLDIEIASGGNLSVYLESLTASVQSPIFQLEMRRIET